MTASTNDSESKTPTGSMTASSLDADLYYYGNAASTLVQNEDLRRF